MENNSIEKTNIVKNCKNCGDLTKDKCYSKIYTSGNVGYYCMHCSKKTSKEKGKIYRQRKKENQKKIIPEIVKKCYRHGDLKASQCYFKNHKNKKYEYYACRSCSDNSALRSKNKSREMLKEDVDFSKFFHIINKSFNKSGLFFNKGKNKVFYE